MKQVPGVLRSAKHLSGFEGGERVERVLVLSQIGWVWKLGQSNPTPVNTKKLKH